MESIGLPPFEKATEEQKEMVRDTTVFKIYCLECAWNELKKQILSEAQELLLKK